MKMSSFLKTCGLLLAVLSTVHAESFQEAGLKAHNKHRAVHGVQPLALDKQAIKFAQNYADHLIQQGGKLVHSTNRGQYGYGENLWASGGDMDNVKAVKAAVGSWYSEISKYDFKNPGYTSKVGHFSQVVWKDSKFLGMGVARNAAKTLIIVAAEYKPSGNYNYREAFQKNVLKGNSTGSLESKSSQVQWTTKIVSLLIIALQISQVQ